MLLSQRTALATVATAEFSIRESCKAAAALWKTQARIAKNDAVTAVFTPK